VHNRTRMRVLRSLVFTAGRTHKDTFWFKELEGCATLARNPHRTLLASRLQRRCKAPHLRGAGAAVLGAHSPLHAPQTL
jgi:hypothetical protein